MLSRLLLKNAKIGCCWKMQYFYHNVKNKGSLNCKNKTKNNFLHFILGLILLIGFQLFFSSNPISLLTVICFWKLLLSLFHILYCNILLFCSDIPGCSILWVSSVSCAVALLDNKLLENAPANTEAEFLVEIQTKVLRDFFLLFRPPLQLRVQLLYITL